MCVSVVWKSALPAVVLGLAWVGPSEAATPVDTTAVAKTIKTDVAELIAGINAHDVNKATRFDAPNLIFMECGSPSTVGAKADIDGFKEHFAQDPDWHVSLVDETVDVATSGDLAVYRSVYNEDNRVAGVMMTHKTNFIAEFKRQGDGAWQMDWEIVSPMEKSHPKKM